MCMCAVAIIGAAYFMCTHLAIITAFLCVDAAHESTVMSKSVTRLSRGVAHPTKRKRIAASVKLGSQLTESG